MTSNDTTTVDPLEIAKFSQHASTWWDVNGPLKTLHDINPARLSFINQYASLSDQTILDIGCGGGILTEAMAKVGGIVTGLDAETDAINTAQQHARAERISIDYVCEPIEKFQLENSEPLFDIITCMEMLEHVSCPAMILLHAKRLLKPSGLIFLSTINRNWIAYLTAIVGAEYILNILPKQTHDYKKFIRPSELTIMAREAGFESIGLSGMDYNPFTRSAKLQRRVTVNYLLVCRSV